MELLKTIFYFPVASYFSFFAKIRLVLWRPRVIVITGSSGKTTLLHLIQSQLGNKAKYSHHANSAYGIPFDILDLSRKTYQFSEWAGLFLTAPLSIFKKLPTEKIYVVEADADRPDEGKFLSKLLKPEVTILLNLSRTHSMNFDRLVEEKKFKNVDTAIAFEFGYFLENAKGLAIINSDLELITGERKRTNAKVISLSEKSLNNYSVTNKTTYNLDGENYSFQALLPKAVFYSILATKKVCEYLELPFDQSFANFENPIGRSSIFEGIKNTTIIDSSYNANLGSVTAMLELFNKVIAKEKWVILADLLEQGKEEHEEHEKLAELLIDYKFDNVILKGPRMKQYVLPLLEEKKLQVVSFLTLGEINVYLDNNLKSGVTILVKGSQSMMLEGIIEKLLENKDDTKKLPRREKIWVEKRKKQGV